MTQPTDRPEFSRRLGRHALRRAAHHPVDETATENERQAVADLLGVQAVSGLRLRGTLEERADGGWDFRGRLTARVVQACVATLAPVRTRIDVEVARDYIPVTGGGPVELDLDPEAPETWEPLPDPLDLGALALEELALALPAYPRAADAPPVAREARPRGAAPAEPRQKPFAGLAELRQKLQDGND